MLIKKAPLLRELMSMASKEIHWTLTDEELEVQFRTGTLAPETFTHEAHLRLAWIHIRQYGLEAAIREIPMQIQQFAKSVEEPLKFYLTLTIAAIKAVAHFMNKSKGRDFLTLLQEFPKLKTDFSELLQAHYSFDIFEYEKARTVYLEPDVLPFTV